VGETPLTTRRVMPSEGYRWGRWSGGSCRGVSHGFRKYRHGKTIGTERDLPNLQSHRLSSFDKQK
jgi:hypothetical protein